jgi:hypothetical protein
MSDEAIRIECGRALCAHEYCPACDPGFCNECAEEHSGEYRDDLEAGGES